MKPNEIKEIIRVVVDYGWPWQVLTHPETTISGAISNFTPYYTTQKAQSLHALFLALCWEVNRTEYLGYPFVRLDSNHHHDWPIETREGMPCWVRWKYEWTDGSESTGDWFRSYCAGGIAHYSDGKTGWTGGYGYTKGSDVSTKTEKQVVAPHPLNPTMEPPQDWQAGGKRILK